MNGWWYGSDDHARAELDPGRLRRRVGDEHLGRGDVLPAGRVVLADPHLVEAEILDVLHELDVTVQRKGRVLVRRVVRSDEQAEAKRWL